MTTGHTVRLRRTTRTISVTRTTRVVMALAGLALLLVTGAVRTQPSLASWSDSEYGSGAVTAAVIPAPIIQSCALDTGLLGLTPTVTLRWRFPAGTPYTTSTNVAYYVANGGSLPNLTSVVLGTNLTTTGPISGTYSTTFQSPLLSGLLGGRFGLYLQTVDSTGWTSTLASATASATLVGLNPVCTVP